MKPVIVCLCLTIGIALSGLRGTVPTPAVATPLPTETPIDTTIPMYQYKRCYYYMSPERTREPYDLFVSVEGICSYGDMPFNTDYAAVGRF